MDNQELRDLVQHGREERNLEYKGSVSWSDPEIKAKLTKAALAMSNIRDGGAIVVGVEQGGELFKPVGLTQEQLDSFGQDSVASYVNNFADPYVELTVLRGDIGGEQFVVIQVREFQEPPTICRRDGIGLRKGAIYARTRRIHKSAEVPGQAEMREILDIATEKALRRFATLAAAGGYGTAPVDTQRFEDELGEL
jgi:predicted HTH transcriptional regulator